MAGPEMTRLRTSGGSHTSVAEPSMYLDDEGDVPSYLRMNCHSGSCRDRIAWVTREELASCFGYSCSTKQGRSRSAKRFSPATPATLRWQEAIRS